jgi:hypothetical protein
MINFCDFLIMVLRQENKTRKITFQLLYRSFISKSVSTNLVDLILPLKTRSSKTSDGDALWLSACCYTSSQFARSTEFYLWLIFKSLKAASSMFCPMYLHELSQQTMKAFFHIFLNSSCGFVNGGKI